MKHYPVIIAGAGPAGATAAHFLAKQKVAHLVFDKAVFPRDKICGDALSGKVVDILRKINPDWIPEIESKSLEFLPSWGVVFVAPNGKALDIPFRSLKSKQTYPPGFISKRVDFDNFLVEKFDEEFTTFQQGCSLERITKNEKGYLIEIKNSGIFEQVTCDILIGAEGDRSEVAKQLANYSKSDAHYCAGIRAYYTGVTGMHPENYIELHFMKGVLPGYLWIFPLPNGRANVGVGVLSSKIKKNKLNLKQMMLDAIEQHPEISARFKNAKLEGKIAGWGLPLGSRILPISGENFMLCGDAASLIDPFTGEGIGNAMKSGMIAANWAVKALDEKNFSPLFFKQYDQEVFRVLGDELKLSTILQRLVAYPFLFNLVVNKATKNETLRETISCMFEDLDMRAKFRDPKFYLKILIN